VRHLEEIRIQEIINYATYAQPEVLFDTMGFGKPLDAKPILLTRARSALPGAARSSCSPKARSHARSHRRVERAAAATKRLDIQGHVIEPARRPRCASRCAASSAAKRCWWSST